MWWRYKAGGLTNADAFLVSYPRSGTTWMRFLLYEALTGEDAGFGAMRRAVPSINKHRNAAHVLHGSGRLIQSHETFSDGDRRIVYVVRDPRSVVISEYKWQRRLGIEPGSFDRFVKDFVRGRSNPWGAWDRHATFWLDGQPARHNHLHVVKFEDLRLDTERTLAEVLRFLGTDPDPQMVHRVVTNNSVKRMREKEDQARDKGWRASARSDIRFVDSGSVGGWSETLTDAQAATIERRFGPVLERLGYLSARSGAP
ncbi:MAG: sulfotransferase domain-containing protein [Actinobacteria bacterium]|nr:sulfotransferase domain-containing protein [Actinomycetota bacterium]